METADSTVEWPYRLALLVLATGMILAGMVHFARPRFYLPIVPGWIPLKIEIIYASGLLELMGGIGLLLPAFRTHAALLILFLMVLFLPLHILDCFRSHPAMGSPGRAVVRLLLQFPLILWALWIYLGALGRK